MPRFDYSALTEEEAQRVFQEFTAEAPERVSALRREVGEDLLDYSPESLVPLWEWFLRRDALHRDRGGELPSWYLPDPPELAGERLSPAALRDVDSVGRYLGEVFIRNVGGAHWAIGKLPKRMKYIHQNRPVVNIGGRDVDPVGVTYTNALRAVLDGERKDDALLQTYQANVE